MFLFLISIIIEARGAASIFLAIALAISLSACGGGNGTAPMMQDPPPMPPPPPSDPPSEFETEEFNANYGLDRISVIEAYENGFTGNGEIVALIDVGVDLDHPDLDDQILPQSKNVVTGGAADFRRRHGTQVAGVIAAEKNDMGVHGVAFDADLLVVGVSNPDDCPDEFECPFSDPDIADGIDFAIAQGARILNMSFSGDPAGPDVVRAMRDAAKAGAVMIIAAGNDGEADPSDFSDIAFDPEVRGHVLIAGASDQNNNLASFSNAAGSSRDFYLVAPGLGIVTTADGGGTTTVNGTSFSTPHIAGALAILFQRFPTMTAEETVAVLLEAATDLGMFGVDGLFGHGLLNVAAALQPLGGTAMPAGVTLEPSEQDAAGSGMQTSAAFGNISIDPDIFTNVVVVDAFNRPFHMDFSDRISITNLKTHMLEREMHHRIGGVQILPFAMENAGGRFFFSQELRSQSPIDDGPYGFHTHHAARHNDRTQQFGLQMNYRLGEASVISFSHGFGLRGQIGNINAEETARMHFLTRQGAADSFLGLAGSGQSVVFRHDYSEKTTFTGGVGMGQTNTYNSIAIRPTISGVIEIDRSVGAYGHFKARAGTIHERGGMLGSRLGGAFGSGSQANTSFFEIGGSRRIKGWTVYGSAGAGVTIMDINDHALIADISTLRSTTFSAGLLRTDANSPHAFGVEISQPLRVAAGTLTFDIPSGVSARDRRINRETHALDLAAPGRAIDLELAHRFSSGTWLSIGTNAVWRHNPDNRNDLSDELAIFTRVNAKF